MQYSGSIGCSIWGVIIDFYSYRRANGTLFSWGLLLQHVFSTAVLAFFLVLFNYSLWYHYTYANKLTGNTYAFTAAVFTVAIENIVSNALKHENCSLYLTLMLQTTHVIEAIYRYWYFIIKYCLCYYYDLYFCYYVCNYSSLSSLFLLQLSLLLLPILRRYSITYAIDQ